MKAGAISLHPVLPEKASAALADASPTELTRRDDRLVRLDLEQLGFLLEEFYRRFPALRGRERVSFLLDEIQLVPGWKRFVRRVLDAETAEIVGADAVAGGAFYLGSTVPVMSRVVTTRTTGGTDVVAGTHTYTYAQGTARNQSIFTRPSRLLHQRRRDRAVRGDDLHVPWSRRHRGHGIRLEDRPPGHAGGDAGGCRYGVRAPGVATTRNGNG